MTALAAACAVGMALYMWATERRWWVVWAGWGVGLVMRDSAAMLAGLAAGTGASLVLDARRFEQKRDVDEQNALLFLVRLKQLIAVKGTLAGALDEMGFRPASSGGDAAEWIIAQQASRYRVATLTFLSRIAHTVRRHGASWGPLVDWASDRIQQNQSRRHVRQLEEAAQRTTILVLALAPWGVIAVFRLMVPSFYRVMRSTVIGQTAVLLVGAVTLGVFVILQVHMRREAEIR